MTDATRTDPRSRIVEVAARLLHEEGPAAGTTRGVADRAGVVAPTIYRLFGDKDGLLEAVAEHVMATYVSAKTEAVRAAAQADADPLEDLRAAWALQIDFGVANPALFRFLSDPDRVRHSAAARNGKQVLETRVRRLAATGRLRVDERRAVDLIQAAGTGTIQTLLAAPPGDRDAGLAEAMFDAVLGQILTDPPTRDPGDAAATAVAFRVLAPELAALSEPERDLLVEWLDRAIRAL